MNEKKLSSYEVVEKIGAGGMGEVYRARDTRLGRDVALKILPESFVEDPERLGRFDREAKVLASLNHPNIASIYGLEEADSKKFLVLELVDGEDLAKRIARGPLPVDDSLAIARQIAEALEAAHDQGVIHRDLKPGNVVAGPDGKVKVLDFGLAKAFDIDDPESQDLSQSPTILGTGGTAHGVILGTAAYMSPEQARGKPVDKRCDIFAFGCVLFEMLTGKRCFTGETVSDTLASILARDPEWDELPAHTPVPLKRLLRRCLEKDPKQRLRDIGEARIAIDAIASGSAEEESSPAAAASPRSRRSPWVPWAVAAGLALVALVTGASYLRKPPADAQVVRAFIPPAEDSPFELSSLHPGPAAVSPDGTRIVYSARNDNGSAVLWIRHLNQTQARSFPGTEGAGYPFWSPDGKSIGFIADGKLKRVDAAGGPPLTLCDAPVGKGGTWNPDDVILFAPSFNGPIHRVAAAGGQSVAVTEVDPEKGQNSHRFPHFLPDGRHYIYFARAAAAMGGDGTGSAVYLASLDGDEPARELFRCQSQAIYASGYLLFLRESALMAWPFDPDRLEFTGDAFPIVDHVNFLPAASRAIFDASQNGVLVYLAGAATPGGQIEWVDREGKTLSTLGDRATYSAPRISPDGTKVAVEVTDPRNATWDIWVYDDARGVRTRFTFGPSSLNGAPVWSPDASRLAYRSDRGVKANLYVKSFAGSSTDELILDNDHPKDPADWSADGKYILYTEYTNETKGDVWALPTDGEGEPIPFLRSEFIEMQPQFSPDGKWVAYASDESGRFEVYVAPFPGPGRKWQISSSGGLDPRWRNDGRELFFQSTSNQILAAELDYADETLIVGADEPLFDFAGGGEYDVAGDGQKFLIVRDYDKVTTPLTLVLNWNQEIAEKD
jgi:serine/threonine protein kinase